MRVISKKQHDRDVSDIYMETNALRVRLAQLEERLAVQEAHPHHKALPIGLIHSSVGQTLNVNMMREIPLSWIGRSVALDIHGADDGQD